MAYITREDGERFVIPSYRDVLSAKKTSLLKREILLLSANYGDYITLQRKNAEQYEVAFSNEPGYLLGESIWYFLRRPFDMVFCEEIPDTSEVILVVVKSGSVHLDGVFPKDGVADELLIFQTQQNNFEIYIHGDVPISENPEEGKFNFDQDSIKSFTILEKPIFQTLPLNHALQLQLVDVALRGHGIGVLPLKQIIGGIVAIALAWMLWMYFSLHKKELPRVLVGVVSPYQLYLDTLISPDPAKELENVLTTVTYLSNIPGWVPNTIDYSKGKLTASVKSLGARTDVLFDWAARYQAEVQILTDGFHVNMHVFTPNRGITKTINSLNEVIASLVDRFSFILPGNSLQIGSITDRRIYSEVNITITFSDKPITVLEMVKDALKNLPLVLLSITLKPNNGLFNGTIVIQALGN